MSPNPKATHAIIGETESLDGVVVVDQEDEKQKILLVQQSWALIENAMGSEAVSNIYERLFRKYPQVKQMFQGVDMNLQSQKLFLTLQVTVRFLGNMKELTPMLEELGVRHALQYGVNTEHYHALAKVFLETMDAFFKTQGPPLSLSWNSETLNAWSWALTTTFSIMIRAADRQVAKLCKSTKM